MCWTVNETKNASTAKNHWSNIFWFIDICVHSVEKTTLHQKDMQIHRHCDCSTFFYLCFFLQFLFHLVKISLSRRIFDCKFSIECGFNKDENSTPILYEANSHTIALNVNHRSELAVRSEFLQCIQFYHINSNKNMLHFTFSSFSLCPFQFLLVIKTSSYYEFRCFFS